MKKKWVLLLCLLMISLAGCTNGTDANTEKNGTESNANNVQPDVAKDYGVFLNEEMDAISKMTEYEIVVVEGQSYTKEAVEKLKASGKTVYSYLNIGSLESWREYYEEFKDLEGEPYEHWEDEHWVDVTDERWQQLILNRLAPELKEKGFDGCFLDNLDVYYIYHNDEVFESLVMILKELKSQGFYLCINGGDTFVEEYANRYYRLKDVMDAVNQESVLSCIDFDNSCFGRNDEDTRNYFEEYCALVKSYGCDVYLLEYTTDAELIEEIKKFCEENEYYYFISDKINI